APRLNAYTERAREVYGPEYDPSTQDFDGRVVMEVGGGKKHGRLWLGDGSIDSASVPRLSEIRARAPSGSESIRPRPTADQMEIASLKSDLQDERAQREHLQETLSQMYIWMQNVGSQVSIPPPQLQFMPPPRQHTPGLSAASNDPSAHFSPGATQSPWGSQLGPSSQSPWGSWPGAQPGSQPAPQDLQDQDLSQPTQYNPWDVRPPY
ncbi:unnamed protein product, partial [Urochloa humidicola]